MFLLFGFGFVPAAAAWPKQVFVDATAVKNTIQAIR
jgi:hypothetical protein